MPGDSLNKLFEIFNYFLPLPFFFLDLLLSFLPDFKALVVLFFYLFSYFINKLSSLLIFNFIILILFLNLKLFALKF